MLEQKKRCKSEQKENELDFWISGGKADKNFLYGIWEGLIDREEKEHIVHYQFIFLK